MEMPSVDSRVVDILVKLASSKGYYPQVGARGSEIEAIQKALNFAGYSVFADGILGRQTTDAVTEFQKNSGLSPTGMPDVETVMRLLEQLKEGGVSPSLEPESNPSQEEPTPAETDDPDSGERGSVRPQAISDGAVTEIKDDALGFADYVNGLTRFLAAEETRSPLAIGITARWGQGKTSFMRMLDSELKKHRSTKIRFVTSWFNPWLYSEPEQVWNAFLSNATSCITKALPPWNRFVFQAKRFKHNLRSRVGFGFRFWFGFLTILLMFVLFFYAIISPIGGAAMLDVTAKVVGKGTAEKLAEQPGLPTLLRLFGACFLASVFYSRVVQKLDLGLIEYLQKKDFTVKAGALAQFQHEMEFLAAAVPDDLRVVIFIDDLDRCEKDILMEIISSLQVLTVSSKCYFVLGLDLAIVARQIEDSVLAQALEETDEKQHAFQHGSGFRFLEKVIQARLSVPPYDKENITEMVKKLLPETLEGGVDAGGGTDQGEAVHQDGGKKEPDGVLKTAKQAIGLGKKLEQVVDAPEIRAALMKYGPEYFDNPRSLKRFMNSFRMHAHLATIVDNKVSTDLLARYFVLAECWPGLLDYFRRNPDRLTDYGIFVTESANQGTGPNEEDVVKKLLEGKAGKLLSAEKPLSGKRIVQLCSWYGFRFYRANRF